MSSITLDHPLARFPHTEELHPGVRREWLHHRQIVVYRINLADPADTVNAWINAATETMIFWPKKQPYLALYDMREGFTQFTAYTSQRMMEMRDAFELQRLRGRMAILLPNRTVLRALKLLLNAQFDDDTTSLQVRIFINNEKALGWLEGQLP
jgi:hypothetical protein